MRRRSCSSVVQMLPSASATDDGKKGMGSKRRSISKRGISDSTITNDANSCISNPSTNPRSTKKQALGRQSLNLQKKGGKDFNDISPAMGPPKKIGARKSVPMGPDFCTGRPTASTPELQESLPVMDTIKRVFRNNSYSNSPINNSRSSSSKKKSNKSSLIFSASSNNYSRSVIEDSLPEENGSYLGALNEYNSPVDNESMEIGCSEKMAKYHLIKQRFSVDEVHSISTEALVNDNERNLTRFSKLCLKTPVLSGEYAKESCDDENGDSMETKPSWENFNMPGTDSNDNLNEKKQPLEGKMKIIVKI